MEERTHDTEAAEQVRAEHRQAPREARETGQPAAEDPRQVAAAEAFLAMQRRAMGFT